MRVNLQDTKTIELNGNLRYKIPCKIVAGYYQCKTIQSLLYGTGSKNLLLIRSYERILTSRMSNALRWVNEWCYYLQAIFDCRI